MNLEARFRPWLLVAVMLATSGVGGGEIAAPGGTDDERTTLITAPLPPPEHPAGVQSRRGPGSSVDLAGNEIPPATRVVSSTPLQRHAPEAAPRASTDAAIGNVTGPVSLTVDKSWNGSEWELVLSWSGNSGATTVSHSSDAAFQDDVNTLEKAFVPTTLTVEAGSSSLECFDVTDDTTASRAVQGFGYDPDPRPAPATVAATDGLAPSDKWWLDEITVDSGYLDPIPKANHMGMSHAYARAHTVESVANGYAKKAKFFIPRDARSFWVSPRAHGKAPRDVTTFQNLVHKGIGPYTNLRAIAYAEQTGHVWVAADGIVQELDIFLINPVVGATFTDATKPYISRVSTDGRILYVDGTNGVSTVYQVDVSTGTRTVYASTTDARFTRAITPVGIAVALDGTACYIADASAGSGSGTVVKIPANNATDIVDDYGSWPNWSFADPAAMETDFKGHLWVAAQNNWVGEIPDSSTTWWGFDTSVTAHALMLDRDLSSPTITRIWWSEFKGWTEAYNQNPISPTIPARYHGALVLNDHPAGKFVVAPLWSYMPHVYHVTRPDRVVLNNAGQTRKYPYRYQTADRLVKLHVYGWWTVPVRIRLIDPPDLSPYVADGGSGPKPGKSAVEPYEANDNEVWATSYTDFGLTLDPNGTLNPGLTHPVLQLDVTPGENFYGVVYLKLPERYAGDNWQIEVTKLNSLGAPVPNKVPGLSGIFTGWKRMFLERERMFRKGGILSRDADPGDRYIYLAKIHDGAAWVRGDNLQAGDAIAIFDAANTLGSGHQDDACVAALSEITDFEVEIELGATDTCATPYLLKYFYSSSVDPATHQWSFASGTLSAGVGKIDGCSISPSDFFSSNSCSFGADLRGIEQPYNDTEVEFAAPRSGIGAIPYLPTQWFDTYESEDRARFSQIWFQNFTAGAGDPPKAQPHNYFHLIGASRRTGAAGATNDDYDYAFVFTGGIEDQGRPPAETANWVQSTTSHELAHEFGVNPDDVTCGGHDTRDAWCAGDPLLDCHTQKCLMNKSRVRTDGVDRLCKGDILDGAASGGSRHCGDPPPGGWDVTWSKGDGAVRTEPDPE